MSEKFCAGPGWFEIYYDKCYLTVETEIMQGYFERSVNDEIDMDSDVEIFNNAKDAILKSLESKKFQSGEYKYHLNGLFEVSYKNKLLLVSPRNLEVIYERKENEECIMDGMKNTHNPILMLENIIKGK